jgi:hypothetical protein
VKKTTNQKLGLHRETLASLSLDRLAAVAGGGIGQWLWNNIPGPHNSRMAGMCISRQNPCR